MPTIPNTVLGRIEFFEQHLPVWSVDPAAIGLDALQVTQLATDTAAARADYEATLAARNAAKASTEARNTSVGTMYDLGADLVKTIRAYAQTTNDPGVYVAAEIPAPSPPTPVGKPAAPTDVKAEINAFGYGVVSWKGNRTGGTFYILERQLTPLTGDPGPWTYAGSSATNDYTDTTIPVGNKAVTYRVYASRPAGNSTPTTANPIYFGIAGSGASTASGDNDLTLAA